MKRGKLFFYNAVLLVAMSLLTRTVAVSFNAYVTSVLGAEGTGLLTLVMSIYGLAVTVACSGVNLAAVRLTASAAAADGSKTESGKTFGPLRIRSVVRACLVYSAFFGTLAGTLLFFSARFVGTTLLGDARTVPSLRVLAVSLVPISLTSALAGYFTGMRKVWKNAAVSLLEQAVKILLTAGGLYLLAPGGIEYACLAVVGGAAVAEGASLLSSLLLYLPERRKKETSVPPRPFVRYLRTVAEAALPVALGSYARQGLVSAEHLAIPWGLRKSGAGASDALASYGVLHGMVFPLILYPSAILGSVSGLLIPEVAASKETGETLRIRRIAAAVFRLALLYSIGASAIFSGFAFSLGEGVYRSAEAGAGIRILAPLVPIMYIDSSVDAMLKGLGEQVHCMKINLLDAAVSLCLVVCLVPRLGIAGYLVTVYVCEIMNGTLSIARLLAVTRLRVRVGDWIARPILSSVLAVAAVRLLASLPLPLVGCGGSVAARIVLAVLVYFVALRLTGAVRRGEVRRFAAALVGRTGKEKTPAQGAGVKVGG
ncbi:MAG: oligosaccharide flippase family protein [Clostridia bacterium]|nr:oligosaccharide flippase family protein [Clostridia bacterium]